MTPEVASNNYAQPPPVMQSYGDMSAAYNYSQHWGAYAVSSVVGRLLLVLTTSQHMLCFLKHFQPKCCHLIYAIHLAHIWIMS